MQTDIHLSPPKTIFKRSIMARSVLPETAKYLFTAMGFFLLIILLMMASSRPVSAHGGKSHNKFTTLQALQKSTDLYNKLVDSGKLDETWEMDLSQVAITPPGLSGNKDFIVRYSRNSGEPQTVYFFLTEDGQYAGSNFTGP